MPPSPRERASSGSSAGREPRPRAGSFSRTWIGHHLGGAERRRVTILACRVEAGELDSQTTVASPHRLVCRAVEDLGGHIIGAARDVILACWGFPAAEEDHARLAILSALNIVALADHDVHASCAVDSGLVIASLKGEKDAISGPALTRAQRLLAEAAPGSVIASSAAADGVARAFDLEAVRVPGVGACWRVRGADPCPRRGSAVVVSIVGHERERAALDGCWSRLLRGEPQYITVTGEAGLGKSTLLSSFEQKVTAEGGFWITIGCLPETRRAPLHSLRDTLRSALADPASGLARFHAGLGAGDRALLNRFLRPQAGSPERPADPVELRQRRLFALLIEWFSSVAATGRTPLVIAVEDLHWADPATFDLVRAIADRLPHLDRACLVVTSRESPPSEVTTDARRTHLELGRLTIGETEAILDQIPFATLLPRATKRQIALRSEGVPLFAQELARLWADPRQRKDNSAMLLEPGPLNTVLAARLDRLGDLKGLAQAAAMIGRSVHPGILAAVLQMSEPAVVDGLDQLVETGLLVHDVPARRQAKVYRFSHGLIRDAAYASILAPRRRELHGSIAEALAEAERHRPRLPPEMVAEHFTAAGNHQGSFAWWRKAGERAAEYSLARTAVEHLRQAVAASEADPEACSSEALAEVLRLLGIQLAALKGNGSREVIDTLQRCLALTEQAGHSDAAFDTLWILHSYHLVSGNIRSALDIGDRLLGAADPDGPEERRIRAHRMQGLAKLLAGQLEDAFGHYRVVLDLYDETRHAELRFLHASDQGALAHAHMAWGEAIAGRIDSSSRHAAAAMKRSARLQHPHTSAHVTCVLAARAQTLGERREASALAFAGRTLGERHEYPYWSAWADFILGWCLGARDSGAASMIDKAVGAYRRTGAAQALPYALLLLGETQLVCGRPRLALAAAQEGLLISRSCGLGLYEAALLLLRAETEFRLGTVISHVEESAREAMRLAGLQGAHSFEARARNFLLRLRKGRQNGPGKCSICPPAQTVGARSPSSA